MAASEAQLRANRKYLKKQDNIQLRVPSGEKAIIAKHAAKTGESLNSFIRRAIAETMKRDETTEP